VVNDFDIFARSLRTYMLVNHTKIAS